MGSAPGHVRVLSLPVNKFAVRRNQMADMISSLSARGSQTDSKGRLHEAAAVVFFTTKDHHLRFN